MAKAKNKKETKDTAASKPSKKLAAVNTVSNETKVEIPAEQTAAEVVKRKFETDDYIPCRSVRSGQMQYISRKSGMAYEWSDFGDVCDVAYGDLLALKAAKSKFLYEPWFIIENEQLVNEWKLSDIYKYFDEFDDAEDFILQGAAKVRNGLKNAPRGYKDLILDTAGHMLRAGRLDSFATIKAIDDVMNTQLLMLVKGV
ncbi:hypothetical protein AALA22_08880 [Anaerovoracaceae bacterium 41-7]